MQIKTPTGVLLAHAALMLIAFGVLLPTGLLLARHKWLFWHEEEVGGPGMRKSLAASTHRVCMMHSHCLRADHTQPIPAFDMAKRETCLPNSSSDAVFGLVLSASPPHAALC